MNKNLKVLGLELTPALSAYLNDKLSYLEKLFKEADEVLAEVELAKTTNHHKAGDFFRAEINVSYDGKVFRRVEEEADLYAAIDIVKDNIEEDIKNYQKKKNRLLRRGGRAIKNLIRGFGWKRGGSASIF